MLTLFMVSISLFLMILTVWTIITYFHKKDSQEFIREELTNLFDSCKKFLFSLRNLIVILVNNSLASQSSERNPVQETLLNDEAQLLNLVPPVKEIETTPLEIANEESDFDTTLSSFSPEVVEVIIEEEEEKVA